MDDILLYTKLRFERNEMISENVIILVSSNLYIRGNVGEHF